MTGDIGCWPFCEVSARHVEVRTEGYNGLDLLTLSYSHFELQPTRGQYHRVYTFTADVPIKSVELLHELVPAAPGTAGHPSYNDRCKRIASLALRHALPSVHARREYAAAAGLMSYGTNLSYIYRQAGVYAGRILKGAACGRRSGLTRLSLVCEGVSSVDRLRDQVRESRPARLQALESPTG